MYDQHFDKIYQFISRSAALVLLYVIAITFVPIPKENQRFVDIALAFLLGWLSANSQYLTGGTPQQKKQDAPAASGTISGDLKVTPAATDEQQ